MKAVVLTGKRTIEIQDVPAPRPQKGEALIKVHSGSGILISSVGK